MNTYLIQINFKAEGYYAIEANSEKEALELFEGGAVEDLLPTLRYSNPAYGHTRDEGDPQPKVLGRIDPQAYWDSELLDRVIDYCEYTREDETCET